MGEARGVKVSDGDAVFIRTGRWTRRAKLGPWNAGANTAGLDASVIPWLKQRGVALLGSEAAQDAAPAPAGSEIGALPLHDFALIMLGIHLFDNTNLDAVAQMAAAAEAVGVPADRGAAAGARRDRLAAQPDCRVLTISRQRLRPCRAEDLRASRRREASP